jgi:hypothetical protein
MVAFAGGMGTQILSAAIYFSIRNAGQPVGADLSYFDRPRRIAVAGNAGELTHWYWQLDPFGMPCALFDSPAPLAQRASRVLLDGQPGKLELGLRALAQPNVRALFKIPPGTKDILPADFTRDYMCMHVRRGDYVNVASHLVTDDEFAGLARKFQGLASGVVILSDSPIESRLRLAISSIFNRALFLDNIEPFAAHRVMRNARILLCSNSTFSLTAAALNPDALSLIPTQWYGGDDRKMEAAIHSRCRFQVLDPATY